MIWSHVRNAALAAAVLTAGLPVLAEATPFNFTFDTDAQGWSGFSSALPPPIIYGPAGGNPGGFIGVSLASGGAGSGTVTANLGVTRALSFDAADYGGTLSFDNKAISQDPNIFGAGLSGVSLAGTGPGGPFELLLNLTSPMTSAFSTTSVALDTSANWILLPLLNPGLAHAATQAEFLTYLPLITRMNLSDTFNITRPNGGTMTVGFDNIRLTDVPTTTAVPEPATLTLLAMGLVGLGARRARRR